jgi:hypothetical protein
MILDNTEPNYHFLILVIMFIVGGGQICKWMKGSDTAKGLAKKGLFYALSRMFRK